MRSVSVLLPAEVVEALEMLANDVPQFVADVVADRVRVEIDARRVRRRLLREELDHHGEERGAACQRSGRNGSCGPSIVTRSVFSSSGASAFISRQRRATSAFGGKSTEEELDAARSRMH